MLTIYMENLEISVGKSNGTHHSIWSTSEIMNYGLLVKEMHFYYFLHVIHLLLRQAKSFRISAENFHPGGLRKW